MTMNCVFCIVALQRDPQYAETQAEYVIEGYAVCGFHVSLFSQHPRYRLLMREAKKRLDLSDVLRDHELAGKP